MFLKIFSDRNGKFSLKKLENYKNERNSMKKRTCFSPKSEINRKNDRITKKTANWRENYDEGSR